MRIPLGAPLESRDGTLARDALVRNAIAEAVGEALTVRKRPGLSDAGIVAAGVAQLLYYWNGKFRTVVGDALSGGELSVFPRWGDKGSEVTLSNGDLTASFALASTMSTRATFARSSGKWYWEITVGTTRHVQIGVGNASAVLTAGGGFGFVTDNNGVAINFNGFIQKNDLVIAPDSGAPFVFNEGDVIGVALDLDARTVAWNKNGGAYCSIGGSKVPTGDLYPMVGGASNGPSSCTANFGATAFVHSPPTGFAAGFYSDNALYVPAGTASLTPTDAGLQFSAQDNGANSPESLLMIKNASQAWIVDSADAVTQITDADYPGQYTVTLASLTRSGTVATATTAIPTNFQVGANVTIAGVNEAGWNGTYPITGVTPVSVETVSGDKFGVTITRSGATATATCIAAPHGLTSGDSVRIAGADQSEYNGTFTATVTSPTIFTFPITAVAQEPTSPATGSITATTRESAATLAGSASSANVSYNQTILGTVNVGDSLVISNASSGVVPDGTYTVTAKPAASTATISVSSPYSIYVNASATVSRVLPSVTSVTYDGGAAMLGRVTFGAAHRLTTGAGIVISGATETLYNGEKLNCTAVSATILEFEITGATAASPDTPATGVIEGQKVVGSTTGTFTFTVDGTETTPATGTITAFSGRRTVPGIAYLNGYFAVMDVFGVIYNCAIDDPRTWNALEYTSALNEPGAGKAIAKAGNYIAAFKEWSTEFFYDAANAAGSPFSPVENGFTLIGCASGESVANVDGALFWVAQSKKHKGRTVYAMRGIEQSKVSTPDVERVLDADALENVRAWGARIDGHPCYVLTLLDSDISLVFDSVTGLWGQWTTLAIGASVSVTSITRSGTTATVTTATAHNVGDGGPVTISGASQAEYNGLFQAAYVSPTVFEIEISGAPATPATGTIVAYPYTEAHLAQTHCATGGGLDVTLHETSGHLFAIDPGVTLDGAAPINFFMRTARLDGGALASKRLGRVTLVADKVSDFAMIRWSDDDGNSFSAYRRVNLAYEEPMLRRCGAFRRRTIEVRHVGATAPRMAALEMGDTG